MTNAEIALLLEMRGPLTVETADGLVRVNTPEEAAAVTEAVSVRDTYSEAVEAVLTEVNESHRVIKRKYAAHAPITIRSHAPVRNDIIEYVGDRFVTQEELKAFFDKAEEGADPAKAISYKRWFKRNGRYFDGAQVKDRKLVMLSKLGKRALEHIVQCRAAKPVAESFESWSLGRELDNSCVDEAMSMMNAGHLVVPERASTNSDICRLVGAPAMRYVYYASTFHPKPARAEVEKFVGKLEKEYREEDALQVKEGTLSLYRYAGVPVVVFVDGGDERLKMVFVAEKHSAEFHDALSEGAVNEVYIAASAKCVPYEDAGEHLTPNQLCALVNTNTGAACSATWTGHHFHLMDALGGKFSRKYDTIVVGVLPKGSPITDEKVYTPWLEAAVKMAKVGGVDESSAVDKALRDMGEPMTSFYRPKDAKAFDGYTFDISTARNTRRGQSWTGVVKFKGKTVCGVRQDGDGSGDIFYPESDELYVKFQADAAKAYPGQPEPEGLFVAVLDQMANG